MTIVDNSLTIVLLGDWNKLYVQPEWVASNIFCKSEMEIGVETQGIEFNISYKCDNIIINPSQERVIITATNAQEDTIKFLAQCATNYFSNAKTPYLSAYGLNIDFEETDDTLLSNMYDNIPDKQMLSKLKYTIVNSQINRTIEKDGKVINIQYIQEQSKSKIHFNEHHADPDPDADLLAFDYESILEFIRCSKEIAINLGYDFEENENE